MGNQFVFEDQRSNKSADIRDTQRGSSNA